MAVFIPQPEGKIRLIFAAAGTGLCLWSMAHALVMGGPLGQGVVAFGVWFGGVAWLHLAAKVRRRIEWVRRDDDGGTSPVASVEHPLLGAKGQWAFFSILLVALSWLLLFFSAAETGEPSGVDASRFAIGWLAAAVIAFALQRLVRALATAEALSSMATVFGLFTLAIPVSALAAVALFLRPYEGGVTATVAGYLIVALTAALVLDSLFKQLSWILEPASRRGPVAIPGAGFLLEMARAGGWSRFLRRFEELTGTRLEEVAGLRFVGRRLVPALGSGLVLLWLSTALTVVPVGSAGILQRFGVFASQELGPGFHWSLPRPFGGILVVETGKVREVAVGFENDLLGPVLWNERHFEGEENFLVGEGDEVLTVNMPVLFRIAKPRDFLINTQEPDTALRSLAEKELLRAISGRSLFDLIGPQREAIAGEVRSSLQEEVDRLGLGLEILFVGLKDMHPPVQVSDAYQVVASAEEDRETSIENARAMAVSRLGFAAESVHRFRAQADRDVTLRVLQAKGAAGAFRALAGADTERPGPLRDRLWHEALAEALAGKDKILLPAGREVSITIDHRANSPKSP